MTTFTTDDRIYAEKDGSLTIDCRIKPLTDEQILELANKHIDWIEYDEGDYGTEIEIVGLIDFARAIQEKLGIK